MEVSSDDYPSEITAKTINVMISVQCTDPLLVESWSTPTVWQPSAYDDTLIFDGPTYTTCFEPETALDFDFNDLSGIQPGQLSWLSINSGNFEITAALTRQDFIDFHGNTVAV